MMKWKRIKCFLTGGHHLYDKNLQVIHDSQGCHFVNYCVKCGSMNVGEVSRQLFMHRNTVTYHLDKVKRQTGLDPRRFYDLVELVKMAQEVLEHGS